VFLVLYINCVLSYKWTGHFFESCKRHLTPPSRKCHLTLPSYKCHLTLPSYKCHLTLPSYKRHLTPPNCKCYLSPPSYKCHLTLPWWLMLVQSAFDKPRIEITFASFHKDSSMSWCLWFLCISHKQLEGGSCIAIKKTSRNRAMFKTIAFIWNRREVSGLVQ